MLGKNFWKRNTWFLLCSYFLEVTSPHLVQPTSIFFITFVDLISEIMDLNIILEIKELSKKLDWIKEKEM